MLYMDFAQESEKYIYDARDNMFYTFQKSVRFF